MAPTLRERRSRLLAMAEGDVVDLSSRHGLASLASRPDASADAVTSVLTLCSVPDVHATLTEVRRVLRMGGRFLFLEHVTDRPGSRTATDLVGVSWRLMGGGCDPTRDIPYEVRRARLLITDLDRFTVPTPAVPLRRCVAGVALRATIEELP